MDTNNTFIFSPPPPPRPFIIPPPPPVDYGLLGQYGEHIIIPAYTVIVAFVMVLSHLIIFTKFRLWHTNWILEKIPRLVSNPVTQILTQGTGLIAVIPYRSDLYLIWLVILLIIYDNVFTLEGYTLLEEDHQRISREYLILSHCVAIVSLVISYYRDPNQKEKPIYYRPLVTLLSLILLKFIVRLSSYKTAERAYGVKNIDIVANYMETEVAKQKLSYHTPDPKTMEGYKYLVMGEEKAKPVIEPTNYTLTFGKPTEKNIVTLEKVWVCENGILNQDTDNKIKDVCLSFALFKLLRRRFFGFRAAESQQPETKNFVFKGLISLPGEKERVFKILRIELEFLRDFFHTRHPVVFAFGFPVFSVVILVAMLAISLWISTMAFQEKAGESEVIHTNTDYRITNGLLIIIMIMEIFEVLTYVFSDWMKVMLICHHVRRKTVGKIPFIDDILCLFCKPKLSKSLKNTIGQYSLLKNYRKGKWKRHATNCVYHTTFAMFAEKMSRGIKENKAIVLPKEVKESIFDTLKEGNGNFSVILASHTQKFPNLSQWFKEHGTPLHTIIVWHIATSICEMRPIKEGPIIEDTNCLFACFSKFLQSCHRKTPKEARESHRLAASSLSKYCAYLVVFSPKLLSISSCTAKRLMDEVVSEISEFFKEANHPKAQYNLIMKYVKEKDKQIEKDDGEGGCCLNLLQCPKKQKPEKGCKDDKKIIDMGIKLAIYLMDISDDGERWKVMADAWSNLILFLAPCGSANGHLDKLASGGEFITHLWVLLYHAGIEDSVSEVPTPLNTWRTKGEP